MLAQLLLMAMGSNQVPELPGYKLVWHDEFDRGTKPNPKDWSYEEGLVRNRELQYYTSNNVWVKDGFLFIEGRREQVENPDFREDAKEDDWKRSRELIDFTSGSIQTAGKQSWTYGRFECRGKFGVTLGLWPAFWMTGMKRPWPANGEIDIMEYYQRKYHANVAWGSKTEWVGIWNSKETPIEKIANDAGFASADAWSKEFHTYRMDWDKDFIRLYLDDRLLNEVDLKTTVNQSPDRKNPFHEPHHIILNLAIGSTGGDPEQTQWPSQFVVDYVRVYQRR